MKNIFKSVPMKKPRYNKFDLSHDVKYSMNMGTLVPYSAMKCVPGDIFNISVENMLRFAPLVSPVMHRINVTTHFFFCPNRILWADWEDWITGESDVEHPYIELLSNGSLSTVQDYLGYPTEATGAMHADAFPIAAYIRIYNEFYRDQNLIDEVLGSELVAGNNSDTETVARSTPRLRAWNHDYFTSCLPWPQKGDSAILPLGTFSDVPVILDIQPVPNVGMLVMKQDGTPYGGFKELASDPTITAGQFVATNPGGTGPTAAYLDPNLNLVAETSLLQAQAADINSVRRAFRLQEFLEKDARGGTRYIENIYAHFGTAPTDQRLQRPEYIGGAFQRMVISEVLSTAETIDSSDQTVNPVGQYAGHGISVGTGKRMRYKAKEHGWIMAIINVQPVTAYQQGLHRTMSQFTREDYYWPEFSNIGEQAVLNKEIYAIGADPEGVFGYIPRYSEYKYMNSRVAGDFKDELNYWHLGRIFDSAPTLSETFINSLPDRRIFAVTDPDFDTIYCHSFINCQAVRPMPKFGVPTI